MTHYVLDCDDVLLDWKTGFMEYANSIGMSPDPSGPHDWSLAEWLKTTADVAVGHVSDFNHSVGFRFLEPMPGARETVWRLKEAGHSIHVLSACGNSPQMQEARRRNLSVFHRPKVGGYDTPFQSVNLLPLGAPKLDFLMRRGWNGGGRPVFVDDSYRQAAYGEFAGYETYCVRRSHNRRDEANSRKGITWIDNIGDLP